MTCPGPSASVLRNIFPINPLSASIDPSISDIVSGTRVRMNFRRTSAELSVLFRRFEDLPKNPDNQCLDSDSTF